VWDIEMSDSDSEEGDHCLCHNDAAVSETAFPRSYSPRQQKSQLAQVNMKQEEDTAMELW
jgi:hypothetical protein